MLWASAAAVCAANGDKGQCSPPSVDKCPVMPDLSPGLSLGAAQAPLFRKSPCATGGRFPGGCSTWAVPPPPKPFRGPSRAQKRAWHHTGKGHTACSVTRPGPAAGRQHPVVRRKRADVVLLGLYISIAVVVEHAVFCGQAVFSVVRQWFAVFQSLWAGACCRCGLP